MTTTLQLDEDVGNISFMGTTKLSGDWRFLMQLAVLLVGIGGGVQANLSMQSKVAEIEKRLSDKSDALIRVEGKIESLNNEIRNLKERLESKKIVNAIGFDASNLSGEAYNEDK